MPYRYPPEFRRGVLDLLAAGRSVASLSEDPGVSDQTIYNWRRQDLIDRGLEPGALARNYETAGCSSPDPRVGNRTSCNEASHCIAEGQGGVPKRRFEVIRTMRTEGAVYSGGVQSVGCVRVGVLRLAVPSAVGSLYPPRWLTDIICQIHQQSRGIYGARRVHAEITLGHGITVGHNAVAMLMRRAGAAGLSGNRRPRRRPRPVDTPVDLVDRNFARSKPDQLVVTDITEHPTREGRVYCAVVLEVFSCRVVGWSIDNTATSSLVTSALGMAIENRQPHSGTVIHSDQGTQFTSWAFT